MKKKSMALVSLIIPVYNVEDYLERCVNSICSQTYQNLEIILVDDGSTDNSGVICDEYAQKDPRVTVVHIPNGGVSNARNVGLDHAQGDYIMFVDSDDYVAPTYVEHLLPIQDEDLVVGGWISGKDGIQQEVFAPLPGMVDRQRWTEDFHGCWGRGPITSPVGKCFKYRIIKEYSLQFDKTIDIGEDELFGLSFLRHCLVVRYTNAQDYFYDISKGDSLMKRFHPCRLITGEKVSRAAEEVSQKAEYIFRWNEWLSVLGHCEKWIKNGNLKMKKKANGLRTEAYTSPYFRECIPYIRKHGSLDEKIRTFCMHPGMEWVYRAALKVLAIISR